MNAEKNDAYIQEYRRCFDAYKASKFYVCYSLWPQFESFWLEQPYESSTINHNRTMLAMVHGMSYLQKYRNAELDISEIQRLKERMKKHYWFSCRSYISINDNEIEKMVATVLSENCIDCYLFIIEEFEKNEIRQS